MKKFVIVLNLLLCLPLQMIAMSSSAVCCCVLSSEVMRSCFRGINAEQTKYMLSKKNTDNLEAGMYIDDVCADNYLNISLEFMTNYTISSVAASCATCVTLAAPCPSCVPITCTMIGCCIDVSHLASLSHNVNKFYIDRAAKKLN